MEAYNKKSQETVNLFAYKSGSSHVITWGVSEDDFILYVGGEGEWFGYDKIKIPLKELKKVDNL